MALLALTLISPLDVIGMHYLLTAHMVQHVIFSVVSPPLILLGIPGWMLSPLFRGAQVRRVARWLAHPVVALGLYNANMWLWHAPGIFDAEPPGWSIQFMQLLDTVALIGALLVVGIVVLPALSRRGSAHMLRSSALLMGSAVAIVAVIGLAALGTLNVADWAVSSQPHNPLHTLMAAMFIGTALLYWWPILSPVPEVPRISPLFGMLYMFMSTQPMMALGALEVFSSQALYQTYQHAPLLWDFASRLSDQQFAGLIMWLPMDIPLLVTLSILFFRWINEQDRKEREAAGELDDPELMWQQADATDVQVETR